MLLAGGQGGGEGAKYGEEHKEGEEKERLLAGKKLQPTDGEIAKLEHLVERTHALTAPSWRLPGFESQVVVIAEIDRSVGRVDHERRFSSTSSTTGSERYINHWLETTTSTSNKLI